MVYLESQITASSSGICRRDPVPKRSSKDSVISPARRQNLAGVSRESPEQSCWEEGGGNIGFESGAQMSATPRSVKNDHLG